MTFSSFERPVEALVVGSNGGLGSAFVRALENDRRVTKIHTWSRTGGPNKSKKILHHIVDLESESDLKSAVADIERLTFVVVATGVLHNKAGALPEKSCKLISQQDMCRVLLINTVLPTLVAKHTVRLLPRGERSVFCCLSARLGSISDNNLGGWYSYRASKAALNQVIKSLSIELGFTHPHAVCVGLHPGTVKTKLSQPFHRSVSEEKLFTPDHSVAQLLRVIDRLKISHSGSLVAWDGKIVPP